jgi:addiction module RelE/StbE family toxin
MANKYRVQLTLAAEADLDEIYSYISDVLLAPQTATNLMDEIEEKIFTLENHPYIYALSHIEDLAKKNYRTLIVKNYVAPYLVDDDNRLVTIARVFHGSMDYQKYL